MEYDTGKDIAAYNTDLTKGKLAKLDADYVIYSKGKIVAEVIGGDMEVANKVTQLNLEGRCLIGRTDGTPEDIGF